MKQRHGGKLQNIGNAVDQISPDRLVLETRKLDRWQSIRNDFLLAGMLLVGAALVYFLVFDTVRTNAHSAQDPRGGVRYIVFYSPLGIAIRHLIRGFKRLRSPV
jgi:hypothetical protein